MDFGFKGYSTMLSSTLRKAGLFTFSATVFLALSVSARADLVVNGGFDNLGGQTYNPCCQTPFTSVPDWTDSNTDQDGIHGFDYGTGNTAADNPNFDWASPYVVNSPEGGFFFFTDGGSGFQSTLSQTINGLTPGATYVLTFYQAAAEINSGGDGVYQYGYAMNWQVGFGRSSYNAPSMTIPAPVNGVPQWDPWQSVSLDVTADSSSDVLSFINVSNGTPPFALLDGISLVQEAATPEPGYMGVGFGIMALMLGMGFIKSRKRIKA